MVMKRCGSFTAIKALQYTPEKPVTTNIVACIRAYTPALRWSRSVYGSGHTMRKGYSLVLSALYGIRYDFIRRFFRMKNQKSIRNKYCNVSRRRYIISRRFQTVTNKRIHHRRPHKRILIRSAYWYNINIYEKDNECIFLNYYSNIIA